MRLGKDILFGRTGSKGTSDRRVRSAMLPSRRVLSIGLLPYPLPGQDMVSTAGRRRVRMGLHCQGGFPLLHLRLLGPETAPSRPRMTGVGLLLGAQQLSTAVVSESGWRILAVSLLRCGGFGPDMMVGPPLLMDGSG